MARDADSIAKSTANPTKAERSTQSKPTTGKAISQEAKELREVIQLLGKKNSPETSKDITAFAKETIKLVSKSQKSESAAFRREATKALIDFRNFVEQTNKITDLRRSKLLGDIDSIALDTKNASFMLLSVAKTQANNIKLTSHREAAAEKLKIKEMEKSILTEASLRAKAMESESRLKSKAMAKESEEKLKNVFEERKLRHKAIIENAKLDIEKQKEAIQKRLNDHKIKVESDKLDIQKRKDALKESRNAHKIKVDSDKLELKDAKLKSKQNYDNLQSQLNIEKAENVIRVKKLRNDLRDDYQMKVRRAKADVTQKREDALKKNKERIQKIRIMTEEHKTRLKKIEEDAKSETLIKRQEVKNELAKLQKRKEKSDKNASEFNGKITEGVLDANPLLKLGLEVFKGVKGNIDRRKDKKVLNTLHHDPHATGTPNQRPNNPTPQTSPNKPGLGKGLLSLLPSVESIIGGIGSFFTGIVRVLGSLAPLLIEFAPVIIAVGAVVGGVISFLDGFNNASKLFGEKIDDKDYLRRVYSGFTNVIGSILGLFDTVAGWLGFDTDIEGAFKKSAVNLFNAILGSFKNIVGGLAGLLEYIPGMGDVAAGMKEYANSNTSGSIQPNNSPNSASQLTSKTNSVNALKDEVDVKRTKAGTMNIVSDNSVKQNSTTIVQQKMDTRNKDKSIQMYG